MSETMDTNFDDFFGTFDDGDGYQTDSAEDNATKAVGDTSDDAAEEQDSEAAEDSENGETNDDVNEQESEEVAAEGKQEDEKPISEQKFVVKVNKETREVSYQDAPAWIQKGMDYDRVKGQLESEQTRSNELQTKLDEQKSVMDILELAAENSGLEIPQLLNHVRKSMLMGQGMSEKEAEAEIRAQVLNLLADLQDELKLTYLFISHDLSVIEHICDRVAIMYLGKVVEIGTKEDIFNNPQHPYTKALLSAIPKVGKRAWEISWTEEPVATAHGITKSWM